MEFEEILRKANQLCVEEQIAFNSGDQKTVSDKLLELKNFLDDCADDMAEEETPEASADEAATEAEKAAKAASQTEDPEVPSES